MATQNRSQSPQTEFLSGLSMNLEGEFSNSDTSTAFASATLSK